MKCTQCPHKVGDSCQRDCVGGYGDADILSELAGIADWIREESMASHFQAAASQLDELIAILTARLSTLAPNAKTRAQSEPGITVKNK